MDFVAGLPGHFLGESDLNRLVIILFFLLSSSGFSSNSQLKPATKAISDLGQDPDSFESFVNNKAIASGLDNGAQSINRTVDTIMESVFYSIMDQSFYTNLTPHINLETAFTRDVQETSLGTYVVIDRFKIGPQINKELSKIDTMPINFGASSDIFVTNIYHRSDPIRAYETENLPLWRNFFNYWFGALPIIAGFMPPSFNLEELYDPITYISTPFSIPSNSSAALEIPIGNIRKYGISGGLNLALAPLEESLTKFLQSLDSETLSFNLPISLFRTGDHTISVYRRSKSIFWVLVSNSRSTGIKVENIFANTHRIFGKLIPQWGGVDAIISPVDTLFSKARISTIDQLYTFDFRFPIAKHAYKYAAKGDFARVYRFYKGAAKQNKKSGISFEFNKITYSDQTGSRKSRNFFVENTKNSNQKTISEIEINDKRGRSNLLEVNQTVEYSDWNVLVGLENLRINNKVELRVVKDRSKKNGGTNYIFDKNDNSPINIYSKLQISDRFTDAKEFQAAMDVIRYYLTDSIDSVPHIPVYSSQKILEQKLIETLKNPMDSIYRIKVSPTHLGKMTINASVSFPSIFLKQLSTKKPFQIRRSMALAYGLNADYWQQRDLRNQWSWLFTYLGWGTMQPLKLFNIQIPSVEFIHETENAVATIAKLNKATTPMEYLTIFSDLFDTLYPTQLIRALSLLGNYRTLPKTLNFSTSPKFKPFDTSDITASKKLFSSLNTKSLKFINNSQKPFSFQTIDRQLSSFQPENYRSRRMEAKLKSITVIPIRNGDSIEYSLSLKFRGKLQAGPLYTYIRMEQAGSVDFGRFLLIDKVIQVTPLLEDNGRGFTVKFSLNGNNSQSSNFISNLAINLGGAFNVKLSLSKNGQVWSQAIQVQLKLSDKGVDIS